MQKISQFNVTIADGGTDSAAVDIGKSAQIVGIATDAAWDTQDLSLKLSLDSGATYIPVVNFKITGVVKSSYYYADIHLLTGLQNVKVVSGGAQGGATVVTLVVRPLD